MKPTAVDHEKCSACGRCVEACGRDGLSLEEDRLVIQEGPCLECGHCVAMCPNGALTTSLGTPPAIDRDAFPAPEALEHFLAARRTQRRFKDRPVERELVERLLDLARFAPSGKNERPFEFAVIHTPGGRRRFTEACYERLRVARGRFRNPLWRWFARTFVDPRAGDHRIRENIANALEEYRQGRDPLFHRAPVIVLVHASRLAPTPKDDCVYALYHMVLLAETLGLSSCLNGNVEALMWHFRDLMALIEAPEDHRVYAAAVFGYPDRPFVRLAFRPPAKARWL